MVREGPWVQWGSAWWVHGIPPGDAMLSQGDSPALDASAGIPTLAPGSCWEDGLGLWASGLQNSKKKGV